MHNSSFYVKSPSPPIYLRAVTWSHRISSRWNSGFYFSEKFSSFSCHAFAGISLTLPDIRDSDMAVIDNSYKLRNQEFLQEYAQKPGVNIMFNGVMYRIISKGNGAKPSPKSIITVHYTGKLINGKVFDQTQKGRPATFRLNELITGWITALREMPAGSRWEIVIPYNLGYGSRASGPIKAFSTLIFDITLLDVR